MTRLISHIVVCVETMTTQNYKCFTVSHRARVCNMTGNGAARTNVQNQIESREMLGPYPSKPPEFLVVLTARSQLTEAKSYDYSVLC